MSNRAQGETTRTKLAEDGGPPRQPRGSLTGHTVASRAWALLRLPLAVVAAAIAGVLALVGAASASARPAVFLGAGLVVFVAATAAGIALVTRKLPERRRRRTRLVAVTVGVLAGVAGFWATALVPVGDPRRPPAPVAGQRYWELPTGSRIAYAHLPAQGTPRPAPVVFLHGGPGVADMAGDAAYFGQLTADGFDVWVYDQVGTGRSSRLGDPRGYTIPRGVADLEAIRQRIGADRMVLLGHSWGAQVAASYLAAYPEHVARVVFSSPGALAPAVDDGSDAGVRERLARSQQLGLYRLLARPRVLLGYALLQVNPRAAHAFVGDAEMDARNDRVYNAGRAGTARVGLLRLPVPPVGRRPPLGRPPAAAGPPADAGAGRQGVLRLPVLGQRRPLPPGVAQRRAGLPAPGRAQRLPGPAGRLPGGRPCLPHRPAPANRLVVRQRGPGRLRGSRGSAAGDRTPVGGPAGRASTASCRWSWTRPTSPLRGRLPSRDRQASVDAGNTAMANGDACGQAAHLPGYFNQTMLI